MKKFASACVLGSLVLLGGFPAVGQSLSAPTVAASRAESTAAPADRASTMQRASAEMLGWEDRLQAFGKTADVTGSHVERSARRELDAAWRSAQAASHRLKTASAGGWHDAQTSYERATNRLAGAWNRLRPDNS